MSHSIVVCGGYCDDLRGSSAKPQCLLSVLSLSYFEVSGEIVEKVLYWSQRSSLKDNKSQISVKYVFISSVTGDCLSMFVFLILL